MSQAPCYSSWCEISPRQIERNLLDALKRVPPGKKFCAVLKADAYGHGIENVVPAVIKHDIDYVGITSNSEARAVRAAGYEGNLIRLRTATQDEILNGRSELIQEQISTLKAAQALVKLMEAENTVVPLHLSLNAAGMSRDGLELSATGGKEECLEIMRLVGDHIVGICTHFPNNEATELQASIMRFKEDVDWVFEQTTLKRENTLVHGGSTLTLLSGRDALTDMFRCGAIMYGVGLPSRENAPSLTLKARVTNTGHFPNGSSIGYDRMTRLTRDSVLANVSIGYANGIGRELSGKMFALVQGQTVPILGKISMNTIVADVTDVGDVAIGDEVVLFGTQGGAAITAAMIEEQSGTILADLFTDWGHRNPRVVVD